MAKKRRLQSNKSKCLSSNYFRIITSHILLVMVGDGAGDRFGNVVLLKINFKIATWLILKVKER